MAALWAGAGRWWSGRGHGEEADTHWCAHLVTPSHGEPLGTVMALAQGSARQTGPGLYMVSLWTGFHLGTGQGGKQAMMCKVVMAGTCSL